MKKFVYLSTCDTCRRILSELGGLPEFDKQDIKKEPLTATQLDAYEKMAGSYEALFSRRARNFRARGLHEKALTEADYRKLLLEDYTFLKRPLILFEGDLFIGNSKKTIAAAKAKILG